MSNNTKKRAPARTARARENLLISLAAELAERKLRDGTASSQLIVTLLNFASAKYKLEMKKMESDISLSEAKQKNLEQAEAIMEKYDDALKAFKSYQGIDAQIEDDEDDEDYE